jgi:DNA repair exonuclease SbcCD nuclease subunit
MSLTFVHTADWHLGHTYWRIGPRASQSREWRFEAVRRVWQLAAQKRADFILVAGDVFDSDTPSPAVRQKALELLDEAPAPVFLISGLHDPCAEGSVWRHAQWQSALAEIPNVEAALQNSPLELPGDALLFPCPVTRKWARADATSWITSSPRGEQFRVGLAHGKWQREGTSESEFGVIASDCAARAGLDYLALGDDHSPTFVDEASMKTRSFYAGTPEIGARDSSSAGNALLVSLDAPGNLPRVESHSVGRVKLHDQGAVSWESAADFESWREGVSRIEARENTVLRARLSGNVAPSVLTALESFLVEARETLLGVDVSFTELRARPTRADFEALKLEKPELALLESLENGFNASDLEGLKSAELLQTWSGDPDAQREALGLYLRLLCG